jgi:hypothetical protein
MIVNDKKILYMLKKTFVSRPLFVSFELGRTPTPPQQETGACVTTSHIKVYTVVIFGYTSPQLDQLGHKTTKRYYNQSATIRLPTLQTSSSNEVGTKTQHLT